MDNQAAREKDVPTLPEYLKQPLMELGAIYGGAIYGGTKPHLRIPLQSDILLPSNGARVEQPGSTKFDIEPHLEYIENILASLKLSDVVIEDLSLSSVETNRGSYLHLHLIYKNHYIGNLSYSLNVKKKKLKLSSLFFFDWDFIFNKLLKDVY
jgi:hypothetical protein